MHREQGYLRPSEMALQAGNESQAETLALEAGFPYGNKWDSGYVKAYERP